MNEKLNNLEARGKVVLALIMEVQVFVTSPWGVLASSALVSAPARVDCARAPPLVQMCNLT